MATQLAERTVIVSAWIEPDLARRSGTAAAADRSKSAELRVAPRAHLRDEESGEVRFFRRVIRALTPTFLCFPPIFAERP